MSVNHSLRLDETWYSEPQIHQLCRILLTAPLTGDFAEIGVWQGRSLLRIAQTVIPRTVWALDTWDLGATEGRDILADFEHNLELLGLSNVQPVIGDWRDTLEYLDNLAAVHIDAEHDYDSVYECLVKVYDRVQIGGILCGDDFLSASARRADLHGGVERAVRQFVAENELKLYTLNNLWWFYKG